LTSKQTADDLDHESDYFNYSHTFSYRHPNSEEASRDDFINETEWVEEVSSGRVARLDGSVLQNLADNVAAVHDKLLTLASVPVFTGEQPRTGTLSTIRMSASRRNHSSLVRPKFDVVTLVFND